MTATLDATYGNVHGALNQQLLTVAGIPDSKTLWAAENVDFESPDPTTTPAWLRETFAPQPNQQITVGDTGRRIRHFGSWMVQLFAPKNTGKQFLETLAGRIVAAFPPGGTLSYNGQLVTIRTAYATKGMPDADWYLQPVTITWRADNATP